MQRRRFLLGLGGAGGLALTGGVGLLLGRGGDSGGDTSSEPPKRTTAKLEVRDLVEQTTVSGTIGYGGSRELAIPLHGTITALPAPGATIDRGGELAEVDGEPVLLLFGERPMWRPLPPPDPNVGGPDVEQLEANLIELGHGSRGNLGPNAKWTVATATALQRWQKALGVAQTGTLDLGRVVYEPGALRVEAVQEARTNHFDLIEVWRDRAAYEAHAASAATIRFHDTIFPWRGSPFEERLANLIAP